MPFSTRFESALEYAARVHSGQVRKASEIPYIIHLLAVASIVGDYGGNEDQVIAALLHDAPEDQGGKARLEDIRQRFGENVARMVHGCTDTFENPKPPWRERKENYIRHLALASEDTLLVSAADKLHNARTIVADLRRRGPALFDIFNGKKDGILWYYREILKAFEVRGPHPIYEELGRTIDQMHKLGGE